MTRKVAIPAEKIPSSGARTQLSIEGRSILIFNDQDKLYAIDNFCPHAGASLANGKVENGAVQCRAHGLRFDLTSGLMKGSALPGTGLKVQSYELEVIGGQTYLIMPADEPSQ